MGLSLVRKWGRFGGSVFDLERSGLEPTFQIRVLAVPVVRSAAMEAPPFLSPESKRVPVGGFTNAISACYISIASGGVLRNRIARWIL